MEIAGLGKNTLFWLHQASQALVAFPLHCALLGAAPVTSWVEAGCHCGGA